MGQVRGLTLPRPVQVHHMQVVRALGHEGTGRLEGIVGVDSLIVEPALTQPHRPAVADVHRRQEDHAGAGTQLATKLPSRASPAGPDFSGWNCTPYSGGRATALTNSRP